MEKLKTINLKGDFGELTVYDNIDKNTFNTLELAFTTGKIELTGRYINDKILNGEKFKIIDRKNLI